ncbi:MAG TPA: HAD family hydrolase [Vicinamibacterales bacterium]|nr:HAD family hydrolase [Vicinamibacterales bacterium]
MPIQTVFLDAGGVLVNPNWSRVSETMGRHGVAVSAAVLAAAEPRAKKRLDTGETIQATNDQQRGWTYFNLVLTEAGIPLSDATAAALAELHVYHQTYNLWETVPDEVRPALAALRARGFRLVVLSNANGTLHRAFDRLGLTSAFDVIFDSHDEGVEKPDPRFFRIALERSGATAETTMHVGDLYHVDVVGARAAGLTPALLDVADLYPDCDCLRVRSLTELVAALT